MNIVKVKFEQAKYNFTTSVNAEVNEATARAYYVGQSFDFGGPAGPENFHTCIGIEFNPADSDMRPITDLEIQNAPASYEKFGDTVERLKKEARDKNTCWNETHFEIVSYIVMDCDNEGTMAEKVQEKQGRGGLYELAEKLTNQFEEKFGAIEWGVDPIGDYVDVLDQFYKDAEEAYLKGGHQA